jgi:uncharacterized protein (DUF58 family)
MAAQRFGHRSRFFRDTFFGRTTWAGCIAVIVASVLGIWVPMLGAAAPYIGLGVLLLMVMDALALHRVATTLDARRTVAERLSNGDVNIVTIGVDNGSAMDIRCTIVDELPIQFQHRLPALEMEVSAGSTAEQAYRIRPTRRGSYSFGALNVYCRSRLGLLERRVVVASGREVAVYPSYATLGKIGLLAEAAARTGNRVNRRIGNTLEFEKIKTYVAGDDIRTINWQATARRGSMMVNQYQDEREQSIYSVIDTGRVMRLPFNGLTLLDYSINAAVALSTTILARNDRAGLITYGAKPGRAIRADRRGRQMQLLNEALYSVDTDFHESDDRHLLTAATSTATSRALMVVFTNIESRTTAKRRLPMLLSLARRHLVLVVMFHNTDVEALLQNSPDRPSDAYLQTVAHNVARQKAEIQADFMRHGIRSILTRPNELSVEVVNAYLGLKRSGVI